ADADLSGAPRHVGRLPNRGAVRAGAPERHALAARRRSPADRQPAKDVGRHSRFPRTRRVKDARLVVIALALVLGVQGSGVKAQGSFVQRSAADARTQNPSKPSTLNPELRTLR